MSTNTKNRILVATPFDAGNVRAELLVDMGAVTDQRHVVGDQKQPKDTTELKFDEIKKQYDSVSKGRKILAKERDAGEKGTPQQVRWKDLYDEDANTCAIRLSYALNNAGYKIPEHRTSVNRPTWTSNIDKSHEYILGADEMGAYLLEKLGEPTFHLELATPDNYEEFVEKVESMDGMKGIIYIDAHDQGKFKATGHVDLIYNEKGFFGGNTAHIHGSDMDLDNYIYWNNEDGWFSKNSKLEIRIWTLD